MQTVLKEVSFKNGWSDWITNTDTSWV